MSRLVQNQIDFFDEVILFADYWFKKSDLSINFHFSSLPSQTKVNFEFLTVNNHQLSLFKQEALRHFERYRLANKLVLSRQSVVVFMIENGNDQEVPT